MREKLCLAQEHNAVYPDRGTDGSSAFLSENSNKADQISQVVAKTEKQLQYRSQLFLF